MVVVGVAGTCLPNSPSETGRGTERERERGGGGGGGGGKVVFLQLAIVIQTETMFHNSGKSHHIILRVLFEGKTHVPVLSSLLIF